jgi:hypothetical protein
MSTIATICSTVTVSPSRWRQSAAGSPFRRAFASPLLRPVVAQLLRKVRDACALPSAARPALPVDDTNRGERIAKVAGALFDQFGDKALTLARRQAEGASGEAFSTWSKIIAVLSERAREAVG